MDLIFGGVLWGFFMGFVIQSSDTVAINGIRQLVSLQLTAAQLSDATIARPVFLEAGEIAAYKLLNLADNDAYLTKIGLDRFIYEHFPRLFTYKGLYASGTSYSINDIVYEGTKLYYANQVITNAPSMFNSSQWTQIIVTFGVYSDTATYSKDDVVDQGSNLYYAKGTPTVGPFISSEWTQISQTDTQIEFERRTRIATQYETAIRLLLSLPQLLEEQILRERLRYQEIDWEKRIEFYRDEITMILEPIVPPGTIFADATAVFGEVKQFVAF